MRGCFRGQNAPSIEAPRGSLCSEEDVRSKVVLSWLSGLGFESSDIQVEATFDVPLGHKLLKIDSRDPARPGYLHPRADVLVRHVDGRSLLIVEVKAPNEPLDENARVQGISYARLVQKGGMAPFVVLTNGLQSRIFDSISGEEVLGECIPAGHRHVVAGFKVSGDVLELRGEALNRLIGLNPANMLAFCEGQVSFRMRKLRSEDQLSGRKYIPRLYVSRPGPQRHLTELIKQGKRFVLLVGPPQTGKTNIMCRAVERRLKSGHPTLFYSASSIGGLLDELTEDFEWTFRQAAGSHVLVAERIATIVRSLGRRLVVFIDGWNEATVSAAESIERHLVRLACPEVTLVVSLTDVSARRLLVDRVGDPSVVADEVGLLARDLPALVRRQWLLPDDRSVVFVDGFERNEMRAAYKKYSRLLKVKIPDSHEQVGDPLLLQTAMLACRGGTLPVALDAPTWVEKLIDAKLERARFREPGVGRPFLVGVAEELLLNGSPVREEKLLPKWGMSLAEGIPYGLFESALLALRGSEVAAEGVDFYSDRERDFVIAYWVRKWGRLCDVSVDDLLGEAESAVLTEPGRAALLWFLKQDANRSVLRRSVEILGRRGSDEVQRLLFEAVRCEQSDDQWNVLKFRTMLRGGSYEAVQALLSIPPDFDENHELAGWLPGDGDLLRLLLLLWRRLPLRVGMLGQPVLDLFQEMHSYGEGFGSFEWESQVTNALIDVVDDGDCGFGALCVLGHIAPYVFLEWLGRRLVGLGRPDGVLVDAYLVPLENAVDVVFDVFYTSFGREGGIVNILRDYERDGADRTDSLRHHWEEYRKFKSLCEGVMGFLDGHLLGRELAKCLRDLEPDEPEPVVD
ncbi:hypothetical protein D7Y27_37595 [Corallococcus sp. AB004]|nr:hypothetical protein D7Y27_37595 [Corallococcus sp. AB004]